MTPPQDDPPNAPPATGPFPSNSPWGGQPRPVFRIGPLPTGQSAPAPPVAAPRLAYVAPIPRAGGQRSRVLTSPALSVAPPPTRPAIVPPPVAQPPVAEPSEAAPPVAAPMEIAAPAAAGPAFAPSPRRAARLASNRTPLILGIGAAALAAVGAVVLLAARQGGQAAVRAPPPATSAPVVVQEQRQAVVAAPPASGAIPAPTTIPASASRPLVRRTVASPPVAPPQPAAIPTAPLEIPTLLAPIAAPPAAPVVLAPPPDPETPMTTRGPNDR